MYLTVIFTFGGIFCIAYQVHDLFKSIQHDLGITLTELQVDGGATQNNFLMQFQSDSV